MSDTTTQRCSLTPPPLSKTKDLMQKRPETSPLIDRTGRKTTIGEMMAPGNRTTTVDLALTRTTRGGIGEMADERRMTAGGRWMSRR
jgi:hypothetical protein